MVMYMHVAQVCRCARGCFFSLPEFLHDPVDCEIVTWFIVHVSCSSCFDVVRRCDHDAVLL